MARGKGWGATAGSDAAADADLSAAEGILAAVGAGLLAFQLVRLLQLLVGFIDRLEQFREARCLVDRPKAGKAMAEELDLALGQQTDSNNPILRQSGAPSLTCIS